MLTLHNYQSNAVANAVSCLIVEDQPSVLIQSATGSGKTVIGAGLIQSLLKINPSFKFLIVVPSMTLVEQFYNTLVRDMGLPASVLHNTLKSDKKGRTFSQKHGNIIITMPETFAGVVAGNSDLRLPLGWCADFLMMDEAHKNTAASSQAAKDFFTCKIIGLTATPRREQNKDGEHLFAWYGERMIVAATTKQLIAMGFIVKPRVVRRPTNSNVVQDWLEYTKNDANKRTILVTTEVQFAKRFETAFRKAGINAQLIEGRQSIALRQKYFNDFENGDIDVLCSIESLCEGFDCKPAKYLIVDRNMVSIAFMHQCAGRVLRTYPGKTEGVIHDYGKNLELDNIENKVWSPLDYAPNVKDITKTREASANDVRSKKLAYNCDACLHVYDAAEHASCTSCGAKTDIKCVTTPREVLVKICGAEIIDIGNFRELKRRVAIANQSQVQKARETHLEHIGTLFFGNGQIFDSKHYASIVINEIFANDLNIDDPIAFCPHTFSEAVDRLAA